MSVPLTQALDLSTMAKIEAAMATCYACGKSYSFGIKEQGFTFCSKSCRATRGTFLKAMSDIQPSLVIAEAQKIQGGTCATCKRPGDVDLRQSTFVWSAIILTRTRTERFLSCSGCARKRQSVDTLGTLLLGWWGIPSGFILTPIALVTNTAQLVSPLFSKTGPSKVLQQVIRERMAKDQAASESNWDSLLSDQNAGGR